MKLDAGEYEKIAKSFSDRDIELVCDGFALHVTLNLPLQERGKVALQLAREYEPFRQRVDQTLDRLSQPNEAGIQILSERQVEKVRDKYTTVTTGRRR